MRIDSNHYHSTTVNGMPAFARALVVLVSLFATFTAARAQAPADEFTIEHTFFRTTVDNRSVRLEGLVVKLAVAQGRLPIALITHGKASNLGDMLESRAAHYTGVARDLARRGWLAVVVMRRGFGQSDGPMAAPVSCATTTFANRLGADADDLQATLDVVSQRPDADPERAIAIGVSAGGAAVTAFAARNPKNLRGVISISGGLRMPDCPKEDVLVNAYKTFGVTSRVPNLWIYARNDSLFGPALVERMQSGFLDGGGDVKLVMFEKFGTDGHALFAAPPGRLQWLMEMDAFLRFHNLPATKRERIAELMKQLKMQEKSRGFLERYLAAPTYKAIAQTPDGKSYSTQYGANTIEAARKAVLNGCRERHKPIEPCRIVIENETWIGEGTTGNDGL